MEIIIMERKSKIFENKIPSPIPFGLLQQNDSKIDKQMHISTNKLMYISTAHL